MTRTDIFIGDLARLLEILDVEILSLSGGVGRDNADVADGNFDRMEYFLGVGLTAVQKYMSELIHASKYEQLKALNLGPHVLEDVSFARLVWAAANYWKHEAEWWRKGSEFSVRDDGELSFVLSWPESGGSQYDADILRRFGVFGKDYVCSSVLGAISCGGDVKLCSTLPLLANWRRCLTPEVKNSVD